jgi:hypothetical protein
MDFRIIKNEEVKLKIPKFTCDDNIVGEHLNWHPRLKLLNCFGFLCIIGRPRSGKTSLAISFLTQKNPKIYRKTHEHILIVMPSNSIHSLQKNPFKTLPDENFYDELNGETIESIYERLNSFSQKNEKTILFIDEQTSMLKNKHVIVLLKKIIYNRRHLKCNVIITAQSYNNIPLDIRKNIENLIMFKPSKKEMEGLFEENVEAHKDKFYKLLKFIYDTDHNYLFLNVPSQRLFKNGDEIIVDDEDEQ